MSINVYRGKGYRHTAKAFFSDTLTFVMERQAELGSFYRLRMPFWRMFISSDPSIIQEALVTKQKHFRKSIAYREMRIALGNGLLTSEGDFWLRQRRLIQPAFHRNALEKLYKTMQFETEVWLNELETAVNKNSVVDIAPWITKLTSTIALKTLFSSDNHQNNPEAARQIADAQEYVLWRVARPWLKPFFPILPKHWKFKRDIALFDASVYAMIQDRKNSHNLQNDLLDLLLHAKDEETGDFMSDQQIRDEVLTLYVAGHETSSNALAWACHCLTQHPELLEKLQTEAINGFQGITPGYPELSSLGYTKMVVDEVLRLFPPAHAIGREVVHEVTLQGETLAPGNILFMSIYALHRNPEHWEQPDQFIPERFTPENIALRSKYAYLPFGAGPRQCIGMQFALQEIPMILASLVKRFNLESVPGEPIRKESLLTLKPRPGVPLKMTVREG